MIPLGLSEGPNPGGITCLLLFVKHPNIIMPSLHCETSRWDGAAMINGKGDLTMAGDLWVLVT